MDPRFLCIIGAQRSGTTWLYNMLDAHPDITMARPAYPEPKYFLRPQSEVEGSRAYMERYFTPGADAAIIGEKGTSYIEHPEAAARIKRMFPDARVIAILRHPVQRAISNFRFSVKHGIETRTMHDVFIRNVPEPAIPNGISVSPFNYIGRGDYAHGLLPYREAFGTNLKVLIFEELVGHAKALSELYGWLGVDPAFSPAHPSNPVNASEKEEREDLRPELSGKLSDLCAPLISKTEEFLERSIPSWHDPLQ